VLKEGVERIREHERGLTDRLLRGLQEIPGVTVYGLRDARKQLATLSFNLQGMAPSDVGLRLDEEYGFSAGSASIVPPHPTAPWDLSRRTVRFGMSYLNRPEEVDGRFKRWANWPGRSLIMPME